MKIYRNLVDDDYFGAMKIPLLEGRTFDRRDDWRHWTDASVPAVAIVNETFVKRFISSQNPIGHHIRGWGKTLTIVGIVKDSKYATPTEAPLPYLYVPFRQFAGSDTSVILHIAVDGAPEAVMSAVRREMYPLNSLASVSYVMPLKEYIGAAVFKNRLAAILLSILGITALILAMLGIYGVMSQSVAQRAHEIGIRVALGASAKTIVTLIVFQGARLAMTGVGMGILLSLLLSRILTTFLYGVNAFDAGTILAVSFLLLAVALLATSIPAYRASRVDSVKLLRL
jgi:ABC-type antimicrobial peptide transport system permease subunit